MKKDDVRPGVLRQIRTLAKNAGTAVLDAHAPSLREIVESVKSGFERVHDISDETRLTRLLDTYANYKIAGIEDTPMGRRLKARIVRMSQGMKEPS